MFKRIFLLSFFIGLIAVICSVFYINIYCTVKDLDNEFVAYGKVYNTKDVTRHELLFEYINKDLSSYFYPTLDWEQNCPGINNPGSLWNNIIEKDSIVPTHSTRILSVLKKRDYILKKNIIHEIKNSRDILIYNDKVYNISSYFKNEIRIFDPNMDILFSKQYSNVSEIMDYLLLQDFLYYNNVLNCMDNLFLVGKIESECKSTQVLYMIYSSIIMFSCLCWITLSLINIQTQEYDYESVPQSTGYILHIPYTSYTTLFGKSQGQQEVMKMNKLLDQYDRLFKKNTKSIINSCLCDSNIKTIVVTIKYIEIFTRNILDTFQVENVETDTITNGEESVKIYKSTIQNIDCIIIVDYSNVLINWESNIVKYITDTENLTFIGYKFNTLLNFSPSLYYNVDPYLEFESVECLNKMSDHFILDKSIIGVSLNDVNFENEFLNKFERLYSNSCQKIKSVFGKSDVFCDVYGYRLSSLESNDMSILDYIKVSNIFNFILWENKPKCKTISLNYKTGTSYKPNEFINKHNVWNENFDMYSIFKLLFPVASIFFWFLVYQSTKSGIEYLICIILLILLTIVIVNIVFFNHNQGVKFNVWFYIFFWIYSIFRILLAPIVYIGVVVYSITLIKGRNIKVNCLKGQLKSRKNWENEDYNIFETCPSDSRLPDLKRESFSQNNTIPSFSNESEYSSSTNSSEINLDKKVILSRKDMGQI